MPQKIKIVKLEKTAQYISTEMAMLKTQARQLLSSSDWTQLPDSGLTTICQLRFRVWRNNIRLINFAEYDSALEAFNDLKKRRPEIVKATGKYRFVTSNFNFCSQLTLASSCNSILHELGISETVNFSEELDVLENFFTVLKQHGY